MQTRFTEDFRDFVADLPSRPEAALIQIHDKLASWMETPRHDDDELTTKLLLSFLMKYTERNGISVSLPDPSKDNLIHQIYIGLSRFKLSYEELSIDESMEEFISDLVEKSEKETFGFAYLSAQEKKHLHGNINRIRDLVESSSLAPRKKNALYERINRLAEEVDREGTRTDRFFAFMGDAAFVMGDFALKAKPFTDEVKDMIKTIGRARSRQEGALLPSGEEVLSLPTPDSENADEKD